MIKHLGTQLIHILCASRILYRDMSPCTLATVRLCTLAQAGPYNEHGGAEIAMPFWWSLKLVGGLTTISTMIKISYNAIYINIYNNAVSICE